jgi:hypothetical protein
MQSLGASSSRLISIECQAPNKQLQRTVRDEVPSHIGQRAAAELRRCAAGFVGLSAVRVRRAVFSTLLAGWVVAGNVSFAQEPLPSGSPYRAVMLFETHFEVDGMRFESTEDLRTYLLGASNDFLNIEIKDCAASDRVRELWRVMAGVISERFARRKEENKFYEFGIASPPACPWYSERK